MFGFEESFCLQPVGTPSRIESFNPCTKMRIEAGIYS